MFLNLIALTMICDMNRVIMMLYPGYVTFNWDGIMHTHEHHGLSHRTGDFTVGGACGVDRRARHDLRRSTSGTRASTRSSSACSTASGGQRQAARQHRDHVAARAVRRRRAQPQQPADRHRRQRGGYLKTGQVINVEASGTPQMGNSDSSCANGGNIGNTGSSGGNMPINKLYVTLMNAVGCTERMPTAAR